MEQNLLDLVAEGQLHRGGDPLPDRCPPFHLLADAFQRAVRAQKAIGQGLVLPQQAQQEVFALDVGAAVLAGLVAGEENHPPRLLRVALEHQA